MQPPANNSSVILICIPLCWGFFSNCFDAQEGVGALWTGLGPNVMRNAIINAAELASYDQVKQVRLQY